jgi:hypothetical protein
MYKSLKIPVVFIKDSPTIGRFTLNFPYEIVTVPRRVFLTSGWRWRCPESSVLSRDDVGVCRHVISVHQNASGRSSIGCFLNNRQI